MNTDTTAVTLRVWPTIRTGLHIIRRKAIAIITVALIARFLASQATGGLSTFANTTFGVNLDPIEPILLFFGSLLIMWLAAAQVTLETSPTDESGTIIERAWRNAIECIRSLTLRLCLRGVALLLVNYVMALCPFLFLAFITTTAPGSLPALVFAGLPMVALFAWVSLRWTLAFPAMIVEDVSAPESLRRSWFITRSQVTKLFAVGAIALAMTLLISALLGALVGLAFLMYYGADIEVSNILPLSTTLGQITGLVFSVSILSACYKSLRTNAPE